MPTAIPFTALGRGNGFPFCLDLQALINVHGDIWDRTEPIAISPLMSLLWNLYEFNSLSFTFNFTTSSGGSGSEEYEKQGSVSYDGEIFDAVEPYKRVCFTDNALPIVQILDSQNTFEGEFFFVPTLNDDNNYCLAYSISTP